MVTEVGRQPWIVYNFLRTAEAVTDAGIVRALFAFVVVIYAGDRGCDRADVADDVAALGSDRSSRWSRRCPTARSTRSTAPPPPAVASAGSREDAMTLADLVAAVLLLAVTAYAILGGADFGAGFWDLFAGQPARGRRARAR